MAFQSHRTRFKGDLAGIEQEKIVELDYQKENIEERLEYINKKYSYVSKYHEEYTSDFYKVNVNTDDNLSADINIFKALERDGSYLLNSLDVPRDSQHKYNLLTQEEFDKLLQKEEKEDITDEAYKDVLMPKEKNDYINMDLKITNKDIIEDSEMGIILRDYDIVKTHLKDEISKIKSKQGSYLNVTKAKMILGTINCDMLDVKKSYKGITRPSTKLGDIGGDIDWTNVDYTNVDQIKDLIKIVNFGEIKPDDELSHLAYDLEEAINSLKNRSALDKIDLEIIEGVNAGVSMRRLEKELGISNQAISKRYNKLAEKIALYFSIIKLELK